MSDQTKPVEAGKFPEPGDPPLNNVASGIGKEFEKAIFSLSKQKEKIMLEQLGDLVSRGLLVWHETEPMIVNDSTLSPGYSFKIRSYGLLKLKSPEEYNFEKEKQLTEAKALLKEFMENGCHSPYEECDWVLEIKAKIKSSVLFGG